MGVDRLGDADVVHLDLGRGLRFYGYLRYVEVGDEEMKEKVERIVIMGGALVVFVAIDVLFVMLIVRVIQ